MKKFTIITVVYNDINGLIRTVESVRSQTFFDYEHIVIDGGSTDGTVEWLLLNQSSKLIFLSESDNGIYDAMNKGFSLSTGKWLFYLNAGDIFYSVNTLTNISLEIDDSYHFICGGVIYRYVSADVLTYTIPKITFYLFSIAHQQGVFINRNVFSVYNFDLRYKLRAESDFFLKCYLSGMIFKMSNQIFSIYDPYGISSKISLRQFYEGWRLGLKRIRFYWIGFPVYYILTQLPKALIRKIIPK